jgi:hypothetical protein
VVVVVVVVVVEVVISFLVDDFFHFVITFLLLLVFLLLLLLLLVCGRRPWEGSALSRDRAASSELNAAANPRLRRRESATSVSRIRDMDTANPPVPAASCFMAPSQARATAS